jgi:hypothetical protein
MISNSGTFSANVKLHLYVAGQRYELSSLGSGSGRLRNEQQLNATEGEIETIVDDKVTRWPIRITSKLDGSTKRFEFEGVG